MSDSKPAAPFTAQHPEQAAFDRACSMWLAEATSTREKNAFRDGHYAGWQAAHIGDDAAQNVMRQALYALDLARPLMLAGSAQHLHEARQAADKAIDVLRARIKT